MIQCQEALTQSDRTELDKPYDKVAKNATYFSCEKCSGCIPNMTKQILRTLLVAETISQHGINQKWWKRNKPNTLSFNVLEF